MKEDELREAIEKPAEESGLTFEKGLVETLLRDAGSEPGNLPLLQYALFELYNHNQDGRLTIEAYREMGGINKSIAGVLSVSTMGWRKPTRISCATSC